MTSVSTTRIYQAKIILDRSEFTDEVPAGCNIAQALMDTHHLFQDAVNYHIVALAGMGASNAPVDSIAERFCNRVKEAWEENPKGKHGAQSLQTSLARSLNLVNPSFDEAVAAIYEQCATPDALEKVFAYILSVTDKGESVIQTQGRELLPKLCSPSFGGNFDLTDKALRSKNIKAELTRLLHEEWTEDIWGQITHIASTMTIGDAGIKCNERQYTPEEELSTIEEALDYISDSLQRKTNSRWCEAAAELYDEESLLAHIAQCKEMLKQDFPTRGLYRNNGGISIKLKYAAIFFMFFPSSLSARLLRVNLVNSPKKKTGADAQALQYKGQDPVVLCRGEHGYVYLGFSALPNWESRDGMMYSKEWDILAFKEALKTLHGFDLKTTERNKERLAYQKQIDFMLTGKGNLAAEAEDESSVLPILGTDERYILACSMLESIMGDIDEEFTPCNQESSYSLSRRTLRGFKDVIEQWERLLEQNDDSELSRIAVVRQLQAESKGQFGSSLLFETLAKPEYASIWRQEPKSEQRATRSKNILYDICTLHGLQEKAERLKTPVRITAAEANASARLITYFDLQSFAAGKKLKAYVSSEKNTIFISLAARNTKGHWEAYRAKLVYSAPRATRDQLCMSDKQAPWLQQMLKPILDTEQTWATLAKNPSFTLSVRLDKGGNTAAWFNFAPSIDLTKLQGEIGKFSRWEAQFSGIRGKLLHLHWPSTYENKKIAPWWGRKEIQETGFSLLSIDLGLRYAAAWASIDVSPQASKKDTARLIGTAEGKDWYGNCTKSGIIRLDGEGKTTHRDKNGVQQAAGIRFADSQEKQKGIDFLDSMQQQRWWNLESKINMIDLHRSLNEGFRRYLSRYRNFLSWCYRLKDAEKAQEAKERIHQYLNHGENSRQYVLGLLDALEADKMEDVSTLLLEAALKMRNLIPQLATQLMNTILPRRKDSWVWVEKSESGWVGSGYMDTLGSAPAGKSEMPKVRDHGGISIARINLLEDLRRALQSMNRLLMESPGEKGQQGRSRYGQKVIDPCPALREKIDNMRNNRVNQLASEIVAQALGVRLLPSRAGKNAGHDIIHGEYEAIPNRRIVDFVVLENLDRYLTSIDRSRLENCSLMQWSHRQIVDKVQQILTDVCGIPVIFAQPMYSSKFDCMSSAAGFRAMPARARKIDEKSSAKTEEKRQREFYEQMLQRLCEAGKNISQLRLLVPQAGGEYFVALGREVTAARNADINAAINIGWRAIAAPESLHLLHRLRLEKMKNKQPQIRSKSPNKREKALKGATLHAQKEFECGNGFISAFYAGATPITPWLQLKKDITGIDLIHGIELWGYMKNPQYPDRISPMWKRCHELNHKQLLKLGFNQQAEEVEALWLSNIPL